MKKAAVNTLTVLTTCLCLLSAADGGGAGVTPQVMRYAITDLGVRVPQGCAGAFAVNDQGQVLGWGHSPSDASDTDSSQIVGDGQPNNAGYNSHFAQGKRLKQFVNGHVYLWQNGRRRNLGAFSGLGLNNQGQIIGSPFDVDGAGQPFVWERGVVRHLPDLPGGASEGAEGINDRGQVVGEETSAHRNLHAFLWQAGRMTDLGDFAGGNSTLVGACLNNKGQVAVNTYTYFFDAPRQPTGGGRRRSFLWQGGQTTEISALVGPDATVSKINDNAQMIGAVKVSPKRDRAVFWGQGKRQDLGTLGGAWSQARGLNNAGQVVGGAATSDGQGHAFLYGNGRMVDLNRSIPARSGWVLVGAASINNRGQIAGDGLYHGQSRSFLLTPVP